VHCVISPFCKVRWLQTLLLGMQCCLWGIMHGGTCCSLHSLYSPAGGVAVVWSADVTLCLQALPMPSVHALHAQHGGNECAGAIAACSYHVAADMLHLVALFWGLYCGVVCGVIISGTSPCCAQYAVGM